MQDAELFMGLAGIAGVFVGFAALIAVRSGGPSDPLEVAPMRVLVSMAMLTIVAALAPVALGRYDLTDHQVWALSSALALVGFAVMGAISARTPEYRAGWATSIAATKLTLSDVVGWAFYALYMIVLVVAPIIIILGVAPDLESALYFTYVVLVLLGPGWALLGLVFAQRSPQPAPDPAALPAAGGSSV